MQSLYDFIRKNDTDDKIKIAIADCITKNISKEIAIDVLAEDLQMKLYDFIDGSEMLSIDAGSNIRIDFTNTIRNVLLEYFEGEMGIYVKNKIIEKEIEKCWDCPKCINEPTKMADDFEVATDYYCGVNNEKIMGYVEHDWEMPFIPNWCPLLVRGEIKIRIPK